MIFYDFLGLLKDLLKVPGVLLKVPGVRRRRRLARDRGMGSGRRPRRRSWPWPWPCRRPAPHSDKRWAPRPGALRGGGVEISIFIFCFRQIPGRTWPRDPFERVGPEKRCKTHPKSAPEANSKAISQKIHKKIQKNPFKGLKNH